MEIFGYEKLVMLFLILWGLLIPLGIFQATKKFRDKFWKQHLIIGYIYTSISFIIVFAWLIIAIIEHDPGQLAIYSAMRLTALIWIGCLVQATRFTLKKRFFAHGIWMRRNFILSIVGLVQIILINTMTSNVELVVFLPLLLIFGTYEVYKYVKQAKGKSQ